MDLQKLHIESFKQTVGGLPWFLCKFDILLNLKWSRVLEGAAGGQLCLSQKTLSQSSFASETFDLSVTLSKDGF